MRNITRTLLGRLKKLQQRRPPPQPDEERLPPRFWEAAWGLVPAEKMHPDTRSLLERLCQPTDPRSMSDPIEELIAAVSWMPPDEPDDTDSDNPSPSSPQNEDDE